jgi:DNA replication and repair protein RecF
VEHRFLSAWRRYDKALKQRNAALRNKIDRKAIEVWNVEMGSAAQEIDGYRQKYISELQQTLPKYAQKMSGTHEINIEYRRGWDSDQELQEVLNNTFPNDWNRGFTCTGPHRAELVFRMDGRQADNFVSRGQQKMLVFALLLSQVQLYRQHANEACIVLLDDLASELDFQHQEKVLECLDELAAQVLITAIERDAIPSLTARDISLFHVEHGRIEVVL